MEKENLPGIYITVNRPATTLIKELEEDGIDTSDIFFVDAISEEVGESKKEEDNVLYLKSPKSLTDLSIAISQIIENMPSDDKIIFMDSLSTLTVYNEDDTVKDFALHLSGLMRSEEIPGIIISITEETEEGLISHLKKFSDTVVNTSKL